MTNAFFALFERWQEEERREAIEYWFSVKFSDLLGRYGTKSLIKAYYKEGATPEEQQKVYDKVYGRLMARLDKRIKEEEQRFFDIYNTANTDGFTVVVEWKRNKTWGNNPRVTLKDGKEYSGYASGCGYDKESTAVAMALNEDPAILRALYRERALNIDETNEKLFGYGVTGFLPQFSGGVGMSSIISCLSRLGFHCSHVSTSSTDVYTFERRGR